MKYDRLATATMIYIVLFSVVLAFLHMEHYHLPDFTESGAIDTLVWVGFDIGFFIVGTLIISMLLPEDETDKNGS